MIGKIRGKIDSRDDDSVIIDVSGVGYHIFCSARTLATLPSKGEGIEFIIETHVREEHIHLLGFPDTHERDWFRLLTTVQGVGVKMAFALLGVFAPVQLAQAIAAKDTKALTRVSGVGPKLAERIVTELKSKITKLSSGNAAQLDARHSATAAILPPPSESDDAISALVNLGYARSDAYNAVTRAASTLGSEKSITLDALIKESLRSLVRQAS